MPKSGYARQQKIDIFSVLRQRSPAHAANRRTARQLFGLPLAKFWSNGEKRNLFPLCKLNSHGTKKKNTAEAVFFFWWTLADSNRRPPACEAGALTS
jgi:hypothetical protein